MWVTADSAYGIDGLTLRVLEEARIRNVLEVKTNHMVSDADGQK